MDRLNFIDPLHWICIMETIDLRKITTDYVNSCYLQNKVTNTICDAFGLLNPYNRIDTLCEPVEFAYTELMESIIGSKKMDWIHWWIYETEYGTKSLGFTVGDTEYDTMGMEFSEFYDLVMV